MAKRKATTRGNKKTNKSLATTKKGKNPFMIITVGFMGHPDQFQMRLVDDGLDASELSRILLEQTEQCAYAWLPLAVNPCLHEDTPPSVGIELNYGGGYRTIVKRSGFAMKHVRKISIGLAAGMTPGEVDHFPLLFPNQDVYEFLSMVGATTSSSSSSSSTTTTTKTSTPSPPPTLWLRPCPTFSFPQLKIAANQSLIEVSVESKKGLWDNIIEMGERMEYPKVVPKSRGRRLKPAPSEEQSNKDVKGEDRPAAEVTDVENAENAENAESAEVDIVGV